jgi:hypothetical protein
MYSKGILAYLWDRQVLLKDLTDWAKPLTESLIDRFQADAAKDGHKVTYIQSPSASKEALARQVQIDRGITSGVIGSFSCVEPCRKWSVRKNRMSKRLEPVIKASQCLHLYRYWDHEDFGLMHVRQQTMFPFMTQVCMNGREYLRRQLNRAGIGYQMRDNCFTDIKDWPKAQLLIDRMLSLDWLTILDGFSKRVFPQRRRLIADVDYQWSVWQSEWATDHAFLSKEDLDAIYQSIERYALINSDSNNVLRYLGHRIPMTGRPHGRLTAEVTTRISRREEGSCIKHRVGSNSVKMYNKQGSVLRVESTINNPRDFKVFRPVTGSAGKPKSVPLRKSVVDIKRRAHICQKINDRYLKQQAAVVIDRPLGEITKELAARTTWHGDHVRGLDLTSKDRMLVNLLCDPAFAMNGIRNKDLVHHLHEAGRTRGKNEKQTVATATRLLRMMRAHRLIRKMPKSHRYQITDKGIAAAASIKSALCASAQQLAKMAA